MSRATERSLAFEPLADDVWTVDQPLQFFSAPVGHRMTVVKLPGGGLWLHSPVAPEPGVLRDLAELGPVEHWVAPSRLHDLYLDRWSEAAPDAAAWGAPALAEAQPERPFTGRLARDLDASWSDDFVLLPIAGAPRMGEWVCLHRPTRTLIVADLLFNLGRDASGLGGFVRRVAGIHGHDRCCRIVRAMIRDRAAFRASLEELLDHDFERIVVGHGEPLVDDARERLARAWGLRRGGDRVRTAS